MKPDDGYLNLERLKSADAPELHRALDAVKQRLPEPQQLAALAASLSGIGIPVARPEPVTAASAPSATGIKLVLLGAVVGPLALAIWFLRAEIPRAPPTALATSTTHPEPTLAPSVEAPRGITERSSDARRTPPSATASAPEFTSTPVPESSASNAAERNRAPQPVVSSAQTRSQPPAPSSIATPEAVRSPVASDRTNPVNSGTGVVARPTELALLRDAQLALRRSPAEALALTEQHRALFARGAMVQERELIAISALARLGRHTAVLSRAAQFERDFPNSPYRKQISELAQ